MAHASFNLHKRYTKTGKAVYYVQFYDEDGNRLTAKSSGKSSKAAAQNWAYEQLKNGTISLEKDITFGKYYETECWWDWEKCEYIRRRLARGKSITRGYVDAMKTYTERHILPYFKNKKLQKITDTIIEDWFLSLPEKKGIHGKPLSHSTANHCLKALRIMLNEAVRKHRMRYNPALSIEPLENDSPEKGIFTIDEIRKLFSSENFKELWQGDLLHYTINILGASTGIRIGEARGLRRSKVFDYYISIHNKWSDKYGLGGPKTKSYRDIPIPSRTSECLKQLMDISPFQDPEDFVFWGEKKGKPISDSAIRRSLYRALFEIGISEGEREKRELSFHTWRHTFNSLMRGKIHDSKLQRITGHKTQEMTEHYTHFNIEDFRDVRERQEEYFS